MGAYHNALREEGTRDDLMVALEKAWNEVTSLRGAMDEFCDRVEKGEARSKYTYNKFKSLLGRE